MRNHAQGDVESGNWHTLPFSDKGQGSNISDPADRMDLVAFLLGSRIWFSHKASFTKAMVAETWSADWSFQSPGSECGLALEQPQLLSHRMLENTFCGCRLLLSKVGMVTACVTVLCPARAQEMALLSASPLQ